MSTIGINVIETDGTATPALAGAATSVTGIVVRSRRGPAGQAVRVSSFRQFTQRFGAHAVGYDGAFGVQGFFDNGGAEAWVSRVSGAGGAAARVSLLDRAGAATLRVGAGYRGDEEAGTWGNDLYVDVRDNPEVSTALVATLAGNTPARLQGSAWATPTLDLSVAAGNPARKLRVAVDTPAVNFDVTLDRNAIPVLAQATPADVAAAINAVAGARVAASAHAGGVLIVSRAKGGTSRVEVPAGFDDPTRTLLGLTAAAATGAPSAAASYTQAQVTSLNGLSVGDWVRLGDGISADFFQVTQLEQVDDGAGHITYFVHWAAPPANEQNEYRLEDASTLSTTEFDLVVRQATAADPTPQPVETWTKLSLSPADARYAPAILGDDFTGSAYVVVSDLNPAAFTGRDVPAVVSGVRLGLPTPATAGLTRVAGADGADPNASDFIAALSNYDTVAVQLLTVPEDLPAAMLSAVSHAAVDYCAGKGDCMFIGHTPPGRDEAGAKAFGQDLRAAKVYGALYWPWIVVNDPTGGTPTRVVAPSAHVAGIYARTEQTRGIWKAPAGDAALVRGALDVEREITDEDHTDLVKNGSVNGIRPIRGTGIVVDASRTLSTDNRWLYVNVRLLFNYVKASLRDGLRWVRQEPNRDTLWNTIKFNAVTPFLLRLYQQGAFGAGTPAEVFTVICSAENNPPEEVDLGNLKVEVYFYPSRPAETILIIIGQQDSGASAAER